MGAGGARCQSPPGPRQVADLGTGFTGPASLEAAQVHWDQGEGLWFRRRQAAKWRQELVGWADRAFGTIEPRGGA
jgi:hypothetical protein